MSSQPSKPLSRLARRIRDQLLKTETTPDIICTDTASVIEGNNCWEHLLTFAKEKASGAYYIAFGFYYTLCWDQKSLKQYVAVYRAKDKQLVGTIYKDGGFYEKGDSQC